jgi:hypothetical protein
MIHRSTIDRGSIVKPIKNFNSNFDFRFFILQICQGLKLDLIGTIFWNPTNILKPSNCFRILFFYLTNISEPYNCFVTLFFSIFWNATNVSNPFKYFWTRWTLLRWTIPYPKIYYLFIFNKFIVSNDIHL